MSDVIAAADMGGKKYTILVLAPGLAIIALIALLTHIACRSVAFLQNYQMIISIIFGALLYNTVGIPTAANEGVKFALRRILQLSIILLGLQITVQQLTGVGGVVVAIVAIGLLSTLWVTVLMGRMLGVSPGLSALIAVGTGICGASAIITARAVVGGKEDDAAYAIASISLFGTVAIFAYPLANEFLQLPPHLFGLWAGASIHEVAQVMATAFEGGAEALRMGAITKLMRVAMMAPVIIVLGMMSVRLGMTGAELGVRPPFPWFLVGFLMTVGVASFLDMPHSHGGFFDQSASLVRRHMDTIAMTTTFMLSMAMAAMGMHTNLRQISSKGARPLWLGLLAALFLALLSFGLICGFA